MYYYVSRKENEQRLTVTSGAGIVEEIPFDYMYKVNPMSVRKIKGWLRNYMNSLHPSAKYEKMEMEFSEEAEAAIVFISEAPLPYMH